MKISMKKIFLLLAIVLSLTAAQAVWSRTCNVTVSGEVTAINDAENAIVVGETTVYGIPFDYLANKLNMVIEEGDYVVVTAFECPSTGRISACTLEVNNDGVVINLPGSRRYSEPRSR